MPGSSPGMTGNEVSKHNRNSLWIVEPQRHERHREFYFLSVPLMSLWSSSPSRGAVLLLQRAAEIEAARLGPRLVGNAVGSASIMGHDPLAGLLERLARLQHNAVQVALGAEEIGRAHV